MRAAWLILTLLWLLGGVAARGQEPVTDAEVRKTIGELQRQLLASQKADGTWQHSKPVGLTSLVVQALLRSGVSAEHPKVARALAFIADNSDDSTYSEGLVPGTLLLAGPQQYRRRIGESMEYLTLAQQKPGNWGYGMGHARGDNSCSQFAVLGLAAGEEAGIPIPDGVRRQAINYWVAAQNRDGGWGYTANTDSTLQMTCAGIASLNLLGMELAEKQRCCGEYVYSQELMAGLKWLGNKMRQGPDKALPTHHSMYALYALERVGIALGVKEIGGIDWYRWGATAIIRNRVGSDPVSRAFALLFLARGSAPVALAKWEWNGDWSNQFNDVRNWSRYASEDLGRQLDYVEAKLNRFDSPAAKASIIFINGRQAIEMSDEEIAFLRAFLDNDGVLIAEPTCNSGAFYDSFRQEILKKLCPDLTASFVPLEESHPALASHYQLIPEDLSAMEFKAGCRDYRMLLLTRPISCALNGDADRRQDLPRARRVAVNLLAWALEGKAAERKLDEMRLNPVDLGAQALTLDQVQRRATRHGRRFAHPMARLRHNGQWLAAPGYLQALRESLANHERLPQFDGEMFLAATDTDLFEAAALFMTGYDAPALDEAQLVSLRGYLQNGGFLLATAACTNPEFDRGFRTIMQQVLPNDALEAIPADDPLWQSAYNLFVAAPAATAAYRRQHGQRWAPLYGIRRDGRWIVVYSSVDLCSDFTERLGDSIVGYRREAAFQLAANILQTALTP